MKNSVLFVYVLLSAIFSHACVAAADSYRYVHVTIDTPWLIFIFLLFIVLLPFVLMAVLYWYFAYKKSQQKKLELPEVKGD